MRLPRLSLPLLFFFLALHQHSNAASTNFSQCLSLVRNNTYGPHAGLNNHGEPLNNITEATSIPYHVCKEQCGTGPTPFVSSRFAQEFSAWLLPYLALLSQLPFGAHDLWDNQLAVLLTVGSPAIAAYSIVITVLNSRWISRLFDSYTYPNSQNAVRIFSSLQQSPLRINREGCFLASLIVLQENDEWWKELVLWLEYYPHSWSLSAASSITWVVVAYIFTVIDSFTDNVMKQTWEVAAIENQGVGSIWLWLIPIVISWLQISPKCDSTRVRQALNRANDIAYVATYTSGSDIVLLASRVNNRRAIYLERDRLDTLNVDQHISVPVYNYTRLFTWTKAVQTVASAFSEASRHADFFKPVNPEMDWVEGNQYHQVRPENRSGTSTQIKRYCIPEGMPPPDSYPPDIWSRILIAFLAALALQWGTAGAAFLTLYFTLTTGLGCRSGSYLIYAAVSTIVLVMLVMSSILAHYASESPLYPQPEDPYASRGRPRSLKYRILAWSSILLRRLGKMLAVINAIWLILACVSQFSGFFDRCYCYSSVIGRGARYAYSVIMFLQADISSMRTAWIGGEVLAVGTAVLFIIFIKFIIVNRRLHTRENVPS